MAHNGLEVADVFRHFGQAFRDQHGASLSPARRRAMLAIERCRTAALGGHVERCSDCGYQRMSYNSCRNRSCPKCQGLARAQWLADRQAELLEVPYFHVVFTVPEPIAVIAFQNQTAVYDILFRAASETLRRIAADPEHLGAEIGFLAVLHTWGSAMTHHPHLHCLVPGGGIAPDGQSWIACRSGFFLPVTVLSRMFRGLFLHYLDEGVRRRRTALLLRASSTCMNPRRSGAIWHQPARPSGWSMPSDPSPVRLRSSTMSGDTPTGSPSPTTGWCPSTATSVCFRWKDYRDGSRQKVMSLRGDEFIRRFLIHVLPDGFRRIRYFGFLGNGHRARKLALCRELLRMAPAAPAKPPADYRDRYQALTGMSLRQCPHCLTGTMVVTGCIERPRVCQSVPDT